MIWIQFEIECVITHYFATPRLLEHQHLEFNVNDDMNTMRIYNQKASGTARIDFPEGLQENPQWKERFEGRRRATIRI